MDSACYRSFLVRLWCESPASGGTWRGEFESIQSGQVVTVRSLDELLAFLRQAVEQSQPPASGASKLRWWTSVDLRQTKGS